jgi:sensor histidine kinase regulating citrate/malate metabolism
MALEIADNGIGIDLDRHGSELFGMYKTFNQNKDARGIGLFITKNQVEAQGGRIEVESQVNTGTTFRVYLPGGTDN